MLSAEDLGGLRCLPASGGAGVANGVVADDDGGGIAWAEGLAIFEWNRAWDGRIDPGIGILLVIVVLPIRGIRDCEGSFDIFSSKLALQLVTVAPRPAQFPWLLSNSTRLQRCG